MRDIRQIIVHCTATRVGREVSVEEIDSWHRARGWNGIGYHYVVKLNGRICPARNEERVGAHCLGVNATSIGVVYVGGLDSNGNPSDTRTAAQKAGLLEILTQLMTKYPKARIYGHRDFAAKACPCFDAQTEYAWLNEGRR